MSLLVTVEIVLALCLVLAAFVETEEYASRFGAGGGAGGTGFVAVLFGAVNGVGVGDGYVVQRVWRDERGVVNAVGGVGIVL